VVSPAAERTTAAFHVGRVGRVVIVAETLVVGILQRGDLRVVEVEGR
jgi:hypothetical protein